MLTIHKFPFATTDNVTIEMPEGALILDVQVQEHIPCLWALVDPDAPKVGRSFRIYGTGQPINDFAGGLGIHIGTYQLHGGAEILDQLREAERLLARVCPPDEVDEADPTSQLGRWRDGLVQLRAAIASLATREKRHT